MSQTRLESAVETAVNTGIGYVIAFSLWPIVAALVGYDYSTETNFVITTIFTIASLARGYVIRRWFNAGIHKFSQTIATRLSSIQLWRTK